MTMVEWQPIETAPKDGTIILLWEPKVKRRYALNSQTGMFVGRYGHSDKAWLSAPGEYRRQPTHWMLLSAPPTSE